MDADDFTTRLGGAFDRFARGRLAGYRLAGYRFARYRFARRRLARRRAADRLDAYRGAAGYLNLAGVGGASLDDALEGFIGGAAEVPAVRLGFAFPFARFGF